MRRDFYHHSPAMDGSTEKAQKISFKKILIFSMSYTAAVWSGYAVVESLLAYVAYFFNLESQSIIPHGGLLALLAAIYTFAGLGIGFSQGIVFATAAHVRPQAMAEEHARRILSASSTSILIAVIAASCLSTRPLTAPLVILTVFLCLLFLVHIATAASAAWFKKTYFLVNPYTTATLVALAPWIVETAYRCANGKFFAIALATAVFFFSLNAAQIVLLRNRLRNPGSGVTPYPVRACAISLISLVLIVASGVLIHYCKAHTGPHSNIFSASDAAYQESDPNVIVIIMDTVRADHLSLYGYTRKTTPNLELFAQKATTYTQAIAPSDMTLASTASLFTGQYPGRHGAHNDAPEFPWGKPLDLRAATVAEGLSQKGYATAAVSSNHLYISEEFNLHQGFDYFDNRMRTPFFRQEAHSVNLRFKIIRALKKYFTHPRLTVTHRLGSEISRNIYGVLNVLNQSKRPFFLFANYMDAHDPYVPPKPFDTFFAESSVPLLSQDGFMPYTKAVNSMKHVVSPSERAYFISQYDGAIAFIDFSLGQIFTYLQDKGLYEKSLIIITADHGEAFGEKNLFAHGISTYQNQIHVPLIIKYPYQKEEKLFPGIVSLVDIMPTIFDVVGQPVNPDVHGISLLNPNAARAVPVISESFPWGILLDWHDRFHRIERSYFDMPLKLVSSTAGKQELYDIATDPLEEKNVYNDHRETAIKLEEKLRALVDEMTPLSSTQPEISNDQKERLKGLGYLR